MKEPSASTLLQTIDQAITERNYGRLEEVGATLLRRARAEPAWFDAIIVVARWLLRSAVHRPAAVALLGRATLLSSDGSTLQTVVIGAWCDALASLPDAASKADALVVLIEQAPAGGLVMGMGLDLLAEAVGGLEPAVRARYVQILERHGGSSGALGKRIAELRASCARAKPSHDDAPRDTRASAFDGFLERHRSSIAHLIDPADDGKPRS